MKVKPTTRILLAGLIVIASIGTSLFAGELRGFGKVTESKLKTSGEVTGRRFVCENPEKAKVLMHKVGRDLAQSATEPVEWKRVTLGGTAVPVLVRPGLGSFLLVARGDTVTVYGAGDGVAPETAFAGVAGALAGGTFFDPAFRYPVYLDRFSHFGVGSWYPIYWGDKFSKDKPNTVDDHFAFAREHELVIKPNAGGHMLRNLLPKLHEYGLPYNTEWSMYHDSSPEVALMAPEDLAHTGDQFSARPNHNSMIGSGGTRLLAWNNWQTQEKMRRLVNDPLLTDWPEPYTEVEPRSDDYYGDFSENNRRNFVRYLREVRGYTPKSLGEAWHGDVNRFKSWDDVQIPMTYELFGWTPDSILADRAWRLHPATGNLDAGYHRDDFDDQRWVEASAPGGELLSAFWGAPKSLWYRGAITVPQEWLETKRAAGPIYLAAVTMSSARGFRNPDRVWFNGRELAAWSHCPGSALRTQFDVTSLLRPGKNTIAYLPGFPDFRGGFFLTDQPFADYPFSDTHRNARYSDWREYIPWAIEDKRESSYKAIRGIDPDRFIKIWASRPMPAHAGMVARYGGFGYTEEEGWFQPWDARFGYVRGVPSMVVNAGGEPTPESFKRLLGWHSFSAAGPRGFDYFHNLQTVMYSPTAPLWKEYMPYFKLGARRDLKKPDLALFWSGRNSELLPRPVPFCFDLGRGDLQALGYSYVYVDETTVRDGLVKDYPVIWDTGTVIMDPETVAGLKKYVENGGTYVALQETGRHTTIRRDTWPISDLTGFKVREVRQMTGSLSIMYEQPLFAKLAGKSYYNRGRSIDYSDYNYADTCVSLEPIAKDTEVIARYEDSSIAIGLRKLGKGRVIVLGSPFWRDSHDQAGLWWPGEKQNEFLEDILSGLGLKPLATADTRKVWREHYLAMNGTEEFLSLHNTYDEPVTFSVKWSAVYPVGRLFDPKNGKEIPGTVDGRNVSMDKLTLGPRETLIVATQSRKEPMAVVNDWFAHLAKYWRPSAPGVILKRPDLPLYELRLADKLSGKVLAPAEAASLPTVPEGLKLGACQSLEAVRATPDKDRRCVFHVNFKTPAQWKADDHVLLYIRGMNHVVGNAVGPVDAWVNGNKVFEKANTSARGYYKLQEGASVEISKLLKPDQDNTLVFTTGQNGFLGEVVIQMRPKPEQVIKVAGTWQMQENADSGLNAITVPGEFNGLYAYTTFVIPADWKGDRVFVDVDVTGNFAAFAFNENKLFYPMQNAPARYMDVTPWVRFGDDNRLTLVTLAAAKNWEPGKMNVKRVSVQRVKKRAEK
jgi:hypothetical protein